MYTLDTEQHGGEGVLYILTMNLNTREHGEYKNSYVIIWFLINTYQIYMFLYKMYYCDLNHI